MRSIAAGFVFGGAIVFAGGGNIFAALFTGLGFGLVSSLMVLKVYT